MFMVRFMVSVNILGDNYMPERQDYTGIIM